MKSNQRATIETLLERNTPQREIARITGIDRKTIRSYRQRWLEQRANSPGVATGSAEQIPPPWPPAVDPAATSLCEPHREFIEAQLDGVNQHGRSSDNHLGRFRGMNVVV